MLRYGRDRYLVFGLLQALNVLGLLLFGLNVATRGGAGSGNSIPLLLVVVGLCLLMAAVASVKRGRDLGLAAWVGGLLLLVALGTGPFCLIPLGWLALARGQAAPNAFGPPPASMGLIAWGWGLVLLILPWVLVLLAEQLL